MNEIYIKCPFCGIQIKKGNQHHIKKCREIFLKTFNKDKLIDLYVTQEKSILQISKHYNLPYSQIQYFLKYYGIKKRNIKEACNTKEKKELYEKTMMEKYGVKHNFEKNCSLRKEWENRMLIEEGITNVFQRADVKEKILETMLKKYGVDGIRFNRSKGNYLWYYIEKYGDEEGVKKYNEILKLKGEPSKKEYYIKKYGEDIGLQKYEERLNKQRIGLKYNQGLNERCEKILQKNNITYEREFLITDNKQKLYFYDFKINNLLIELNGVYWHCSPKKYKINDIVKFPNNTYKKVSDIWEKDNRKKQFAIDNGYTLLTIWEDEFSEEFLINKIKELEYGNSKDKKDNQAREKT